MILVTGGLGFIGNELVRQLKSKGEQVAIIDNKNRIAPAIDDILDVPLYQTDITDAAAVKAVFEQVRPKVVYHLAAIHYIPECNDNPERTLRVNVEGTSSILNAAAATGVEKILFASSGAVYADSAGALSEQDEVAPVDIYGWSKWFGEELCQYHHQVHKTPLVVCRLFNNYGPRETNMHIIPEVIRQISEGDRLRLGNITTTRDYIHTSDCAQALIRLADCANGGIQIVNVAHGHGFTVREMIDKIEGITVRRFTIETDTARIRKVDKQTQVADIGLLERLTGWKPQVDIGEGLKDLLRFEGVHF
jgi:UDP-glucose 4-epimerase